MTLTNAPEPTPALPRLTRDYDVQVRLGEGGFGEVYAGWDKRLQRPVALKFLRGGSEAQRETQRETLLREARLSASLRHPALAAVYDVLMEDDAAVIVMERVFGQTLKQRIAQQPPTFGEILRILHQTASVLAHLHRHGLAHGDIKLSNLMLDAEGQLRVLDFGLARLVDAPSATAPEKPAQVLGTPAFMAPERRAGAPPTLTSDVYSLGVVGQMLLEAGIAAGSFDTGGAPGSAVRRELDDLLLRMTRRQPEQRPATMAQVATVLQRLLAPAVERSEPREVSDEATAALAATPARPRRLRIGLALAAVPVLAAVAWGLASLRDFAIPVAADDATATAAIETTPALLARAERLLLDFDRDDAVEDAIELLEPALVPGTPNAPVASLLALAYGLRYVNDERDPLWLQRAQASAEMAMEADDQYVLAHVAQARVLEYQGEYADAANHYATAAALQPDNLWMLLGRIQMATAQAHNDEARTLIADALARHPRERLLWDSSGTLHFRQGNYLAAESDFRHSIELRPDSATAYSNLSATLLRLGRGEDAMKELRRGLEIRPSGRLYSNLGTALYARARYAEAAAAFEAAVSDTRGSPNEPLRWANLADALRQVPGRESDAAAAYTRALQLLEPQLAAGDANPSRLGRAALYAARLGRAREAQDYLSRAQATAGEGNADIWFRALLVAEALGWREQALAYLERALSAGYPQHLIETEPDLVSLRRDTRYHTNLSRSPP